MSPFGEAHNHNIEASSRLGAVIQSYLRAGVFYIQNPNNLPNSRDSVADRVNRPDAPDVVFANGGLTGPGGHPTTIAQANVARGLWTATDGEGAFFFSVENLSAAYAVLPRLMETRPDFIKIYLLYSDEYDSRLRDPMTAGWRGLDPNIVADVVRRAHSLKLRVVAHVESAADFGVAVRAGVDQIAHMPGFRGDHNTALPDPSRYAISEEDARSAGRQGVVVVTTLAGLAEYADERRDAVLRDAANTLNRRNLAFLTKNGVSIAIGSDAYDDTSLKEALYLSTLGVLDSAAMLRSWSETTPRAIVLGRQVGRLAIGYEASFLVLADNPINDVSNVTRIRFRLKQGQVLTVQ